MTLSCVLKIEVSHKAQASHAKVANAHNMHNASPPRIRITVHRIHNRLRYRLKQILRLQIRLPQALRDTEQLLARRPREHKVLGEVQAPDQVRGGDEGLVAAGGREGDVELLVACTKVDAGALQGLVVASVAKAQTYMDAAPSQFLMNPTTVPSAVLA